MSENEKQLAECYILTWKNTMKSIVEVKVLLDPTIKASKEYVNYATQQLKEIEEHRDSRKYEDWQIMVINYLDKVRRTGELD